MPNAELMTKSEAKKQSPRSNASSFELRDSFVIRNSCFVISNFVDLTMGKLPKLAQISKWKFVLVPSSAKQIHD